MSKDFWQWFDKQRNGIPVREIERRGGAPHGRISNAYHRKKEPSALVCETIAKGLGLDPVEVMRRAGVIQLSPDLDNQPGLEAMLREIWQAWKGGALTVKPAEPPAIRESPAPYELPPVPPVPDDEHIMDLFKLLDSFRQRLVYDFARWQLKEQLNPLDSSGKRKEKLQEWGEDIGLINLMTAVDEASPQDRDAFIAFLQVRYESKQGQAE